jgi:hypothetical protein
MWQLPAAAQSPSACPVCACPGRAAKPRDSSNCSSHFLSPPPKCHHAQPEQSILRVLSVSGAFTESGAQWPTSAPEPGPEAVLLTMPLYSPQVRRLRATHCRHTRSSQDPRCRFQVSLVVPVLLVRDQMTSVVGTAVTKLRRSSFLSHPENGLRRNQGRRALPWPRWKQPFSEKPNPQSAALRMCLGRRPFFRYGQRCDGRMIQAREL